MRKLKNVTVTLDRDTARWARVEAARRNTSVSRMLGDLLRREMEEDAEYSAAMARYLAQEPGHHPAAAGERPTRDDLHDRDVLR